MAEFKDDSAMDAVRCLRDAVKILKANPQLLQTSELSFFKQYVESLGGSIPKATTQETKQDDKTYAQPRFEENETKGQASSKNVGKDGMPCAWIIDDSDEEEDMLPTDPDVIAEQEGDVFPIQDMGNPKKELTEEDYERANALKCEALDAFNDGHIENAIELFTRLIRTSPTPAAYANRGMCFLRLRKPVAAVRDATKALELNPDHCKAFKVRGLAKAMLGRWEEAAHDMGEGQKIDYDQETYEQQKRVAKRIEELHAYEHRVRAKAELRRKLQQNNAREARPQRSCDA